MRKSQRSDAGRGVLPYAHVKGYNSDSPFSYTGPSPNNLPHAWGRNQRRGLESGRNRSHLIRLLVIALILTAILAPSTPSSAQEPGPARLGVDGFPPKHNIPIAALGDGALAFNGLTWGRIDPEPGGLPFGDFLATTERELLLDLSLLNSWALEYADSLIVRIKPEAHATWQQAVSRVVTETSVDFLQIGSEPEREWLGAAGFVEALCLAYDAAKEADPDVLVLAAGFNPAEYFALGADQQAESGMADKIAFMQTVIAEAGACYDVLTFHASRGYETIPPTVAWFRDQMAAAGYDKPIWVDEMHSGPWWDGPFAAEFEREMLADMDAGDLTAINTYRGEQAAEMVKKAVTLFGSGVERVFVSSDVDVPGHPVAGWRYAGLLDREGNPKPAYYAYQQMINHLDHFTSVEKIADTVYLFQPQGVIVAWYDDESGAMLPFELSAHLDSDVAWFEWVITVPDVTDVEPVAVYADGNSLRWTPIFIWANPDP